MGPSLAEIQELADKILERLGQGIRSGQIIIHYNDGLVQRLETRTHYRLRRSEAGCRQTQSTPCGRAKLSP